MRPLRKLLAMAKPRELVLGYKLTWGVWGNGRENGNLLGAYMGMETTVKATI